MVQHEGYIDDWYELTQSVLRKYLEEGYASQTIRQDAAQGPGCTKGIRRPADKPPLPKVARAMTIADVASHLQDASRPK